MTATRPPTVTYRRNTSSVAFCNCVWVSLSSDPVPTVFPPGGPEWREKAMGEAPCNEVGKLHVSCTYVCV